MMESIRLALRTFGSDTILNHHLSQKLKLVGRDKFNRYFNITRNDKEGIKHKEVGVELLR
jgi:hypothetical protein